MFDDSFYQIGQGEIFTKSQCMWHERTLMEFFCSILINLGYQAEDSARRRWKRKNKTVIVCLADDFNVCGANLTLNPDQWFDPQTIIITDNHMTVPTEYEICQLPSSYFGIFFYRPELWVDHPIRRFNFSVNRLDTQRALIFLELIKQSGSIDSVLELDYINFNSWSNDSNNDTVESVRKNFIKCYEQFKKQIPDIYHQHAIELIGHLPVRNHLLSIEQANVKAFLIPVIETYSGNVNMAFSEKIFRSLQTPVPWTLYSTTGAVKFLKELGFDTLDDIIDHSYNNVEQDSVPSLKKIETFVSGTMKNYEKIQTMNWTSVQIRCQQAAKHNQEVLRRYQQCWPKDFANWLPKTVEKLM